MPTGANRQMCLPILPPVQARRYDHPQPRRFVGASSMPFSEYKRRPGDRVGLNWRIPNVHGKRAIRHVVYDTTGEVVHQRKAMRCHGRSRMPVAVWNYA